MFEMSLIAVFLFAVQAAMLYSSSKATFLRSHIFRRARWLGWRSYRQMSAQKCSPIVRRLQPLLAAQGRSFAMRRPTLASREIYVMSPLDVSGPLFG